MRSQRRILTWLSITGFSVLALGLAAGALHTVPPALADSGDGWLGVQLQNLDSDLREALDLESGLRGVLVSDVVDGSPADRAGIRRGDVITEIDDERVRNVGDVVDLVRDREPGDKILVVVNRDGSNRGISAVLGELQDRDMWFEAPVDEDVRNHFDRRDNRRAPRPGMDREDRDDEEDGNTFEWKSDEDDDGHGPRVFRWHSDDEDDDGDAPNVFRWHGDDGDDDVVIELRDRKRDRKHMRVHPRVQTRMSGGFLGVRTMELSDQLAEYFGTSEEKGVLVTEVVKDSPAESAGLRAGDIIVTVDGRDIEDPGDLRQAVRRMDPEESVDVEILREGSRRTLSVTLGDAKDFGSLVPEAPWAPDAPRMMFLPQLEHLGAVLPELEHLEIDMPDLEGLLEGLPEQLRLEGLRESIQELRENLHRLRREAREKHGEAMRLRHEAVKLRNTGTI